MEQTESLFNKVHRYFTFRLPTSYKRARANRRDFYKWNVDQVPNELIFEGKKMRNPGRWNGVFVVHGMGIQKWTETAVELRSGFEEAMELILKTQKGGTERPAPQDLPVPYIHEGFWADYAEFESSMETEAKRMNEHQLKFYRKLWEKRTRSAWTTLWWILGQQSRLLNPTIICRIHFLAWLLYIPLQIVSIVSLLAALLFYRRALVEVLADVRLYVDPKGVVERAIVQRIDQRVGASFLQMLGLNWDFHPARKDEKLRSGKKPLEFDRVTWVAHSLGTVISYNVLSDLFARARQLEKNGDAQQKNGVKRFRKSLRRFITLGSPLDKIAFLFGKDVLRPWTDEDRLCFWDHTQKSEYEKSSSDDWWINFYHVLDPVSGALSSSLICRSKPPRNFHMGFCKIPGFAHTAYWNDKETLRYILGRVYGRDFLQDKEYIPYPSWVLTLFAMVSYFIWLGILIGGVVGIVFMWVRYDEIKDIFWKLVIG